MADTIRHDFGVNVLKETTRGTYISPTAALGLMAGAKRPSADYNTKEVVFMTGYDADGRKLVQDPTNPKASFDFNHFLPLAMKDSPDNAVTYLMEACGMEVAAIVSPSAGFKWTHVTGAGTTLSMDVVGTRETTSYKEVQGSFDISFALDESLEMEFKMGATQTGNTVELASAAANNTVPSMGLSGDSDVLYYNSANPATINGSPACITNAKFSQGNNITDSECLSGKSRAITRKTPTLSFSQRLTVDFDASFNDVTNATEFNIVIPVSNRAGTAVGQFVFPKCVVSEDSPDDSDGLLELTRTLDCRPTVGDDNYYFELYT